jgi:hypothetical protein
MVVMDHPFAAREAEGVLGVALNRAGAEDAKASAAGQDVRSGPPHSPH